MNKLDNIFIAGGRGMVGSTIADKLKMQGYSNIIVKSSKELDLRKQDLVENFFAKVKPQVVVLTAARVGEI